jgi:ankyrin repeat protein
VRHCFPPSLRRILQELPESLDETYECILKNMNKGTRAHAHRLLQCLTVAVRPLRLEELAEVLAFDFDEAPGGIPRLNADWRREDQEQAVLSTCSSLITVVHDGRSRVVQFSHFSVKEFLTSDRLAAAAVGDVSFHHILLEPAHTILAQACLGVLLHLDDSTRETSVQRSPLADYAAQHWVDHALFENVSSRVKDGMENLFDPDKPHFSRWIRIHDMDRHDWGLVLHYDETRPERLEAPSVYYAARCGFRDVVEKLISEHPEHVSSRGGAYGTALHIAARKNHLKVGQSLLEHGADVNALGPWKWTPLHSASELGHLEIGQLLLEHGADVNAKENDHQTPLHLAAENGYFELVRTLLRHNSDVNSQIFDGDTPLHRTSENGHVDIARLLLDHGADVNALGQQGWTPLHVASIWGQLELGQLLLEHGADVNAKDGDHWTPLHLAAASGYFELVRTLLKHNADVNALISDGDTPLHKSSVKGRLDVARLLLDHGADPRAHGKDQRTPLHLASFYGKLGVAQLLLEHGADVDAEDAEGNTTYQIALKRGRDKIAQLLAGHGVENKR